MPLGQLSQQAGEDQPTRGLYIHALKCSSREAVSSVANEWAYTICANASINIGNQSVALQEYMLVKIPRLISNCEWASYMVRNSLNNWVILLTFL